MGTNLGMIGNISSSAGILILQGENDTSAPVQEAFMLQQRLTDVSHPDHTLITYPRLGHELSPAIGEFNGSSRFAESWTYRRLCFGGSLFMARGSFRSFTSLRYFYRCQLQILKLLNTFNKGANIKPKGKDHEHRNEAILAWDTSTTNLCT